MAVTSVTAIVTGFIVDTNTPANNNTFYVAFFGSDGSYSSSISVNADITQTTQQVCSAIATAVANAVNTALGTSLTASNVILLNRPNDGAGTISSGTIASGSIGNVQIASGGLTSGAIASGSIDGAFLASGAVRSGHVGNAAVVSGSIASGSIGTVHIASGGLLSGAIASGSIGHPQIASGSLETADVASGGFRSGAIASGQIGRVHIASGGLTSGAIASGSIDGAFLASGAIVSGDIGNNAVVSGSIASGQIGHFHVASGTITSGQIGVSAGTPDGTQFLRDDFTWSPITASILSGSVSSGDIASGAVNGFFGPTRNIASGTVGNFDLGSGAVVAGTVGSGAVVSGNIASGQIGKFHLASGGIVQSGSIGSGAVTGQAGGGAFVIASGTIRNFDLGSGAILSGNIASGQIGANLIAAGGVTSGAIASGVIGKFHLASGGVVQSGSIGSGAVAGQRGGLSIGIASGTVGHFDFGSGAIQSGDIASGQVGESHIASGTAVDAAAHVIDDFSAGGTPLLTEENVSGFVAVCVSQSGRIRVAMPAVSGRMPAVGFAVSGALSGQQCSFWTDGFFQIPANSGSYDFSGRLGGLLYIARSGQIGPISGGFSSGGFLSGDITQRVGTIINSGGVRVMLAPFTKDSVISTPGTFWISSGDIASGQIGFGHLANASVQSGTVASGQVAGPHLASGVINAISGNITISSGMLLVAGSGSFSGSLFSNKYVMGFDLSLNPVVGNQSVIMTWWGMQLRGNQQSNIDVASGQVEAYGPGNVFSVGIPIQKSSGAVGLAIISASGQVGDMTAWYGSGGASGGLLGTVFAAVNASGTFRGSLASGMVATYGRNDYEDTFVANEAISGLVAVALDSGGVNVVRAQPGSGLRMPAIGISVTNVVSGAICPFISFGKLLVSASGALAGSGFTGIQNTAYVGSGGLLLNLSGFVTGASSGGGPAVAGTSGRIVQRVGTFISGGIMVEIDRSMTSGLISLPGGAPSY